MSKTFVLFAFSLLSCLGAAPAHSAWSDVFPGDPRRPDPNSNLASFIVADPGCDATVTDIVSAVLAYGKVAWPGKNGDADSAEKKIQSLIFPPASKPQDCVATAERAYAVASTFLLGLNNSSDHDNSPDTYGGHRLSNGMEFTLLSAFLANQGKIHFLDDSWKSRSAINARVRGAYDCADSTIYLDPRLHPVNLAATLLHEMDHLFRDKLVDIAQLESEFSVNSAAGSATQSPASSKDGWSSFILMDEALAIVQSTFEQRRLQNQKITVPAFWPGGGRYHDVTPYQLKDDANFFAPKGPLSELYLSCGWGNDENNLLSEFLQTVFLRKDEALTCHQEALQAGDRGKIYESIFESYFPGSGSISPAVQEGLTPAMHGMELGQLATWIQQHKIIFNVFHPSDFPIDSIICDDLGAGNGCVVYQMDQYIDALTSFKSKLSSSSPSCDLYTQAVASGALANYVGTQVGGRPSTDGVRPVTPQSSSQSSKKAQDNSQITQSILDANPTLPGQNMGNRITAPKMGLPQPLLTNPDFTNPVINPAGSTDGVRPSLDSIRPCFDLEDKI